MKKFVLLIFLILSACLALAQQSPSDSLLMRKHGHLQFAGTNENLKDSIVEKLLTVDDFALYQQARKNYKIAIPLWTISGTALGTAIALLITGIIFDAQYVPEYNVVETGVLILGGAAGGSLTIGAICFLIPAIVLTKRCNKTLDGIAQNYNQRKSSVSLKLGLTHSGVGLTLIF